MWKCKFCSIEYDFKETHQKANHSRWCNKRPDIDNIHKNNGKLMKSLLDKKYGLIKTFMLKCTKCSNNFKIEKRKKIFNPDNHLFCSQSCANKMGGEATAKKYFPDEIAHYRTLAFRYRDKWCYACGHDKVLDIHHLDGNHNNNKKENLIPLCPNHHRMVHSRWKKEVTELLNNNIHFGK